MFGIGIDMVAETHVKQWSAWRKCKEIHVKQGAAWRKCKEVWEKQGSVWRKVFEGVPLAVSIPPFLAASSVYGAVLSINITPIIIGGSAPYTYLWEKITNSFDVNNSFVTGSILNLTSTKPKISNPIKKPNLEPDEEYASFTETWRLKVTDSAGNIAFSRNCVAQFAFGLGS